MKPVLEPQSAAPRAEGVSRLGMAAVVIMATGFGWLGGNFSTSTDTLSVKIAIALGHLILPAVLALLAGPLAGHSPSPGARRGVTIVAWLAILFVAGSTAYALANPNPNAFGPHNFADYTAVVILLAGAVLWLLPRLAPASR
jgi:hypothetical protein